MVRTTRPQADQKPFFTAVFCGALTLPRYGSLLRCVHLTISTTASTTPTIIRIAKMDRPMRPSAKTRFTGACRAVLRTGRTETEVRSETGAAAKALAVITYGLDSTLKGPATSAVAVNLP